MISRTRLPKKPIRGTYIEQFLVSVLCEGVPGMISLHAESGAGKSVAVLLAALEVGRGWSSEESNYYVVVQNDLNQRLCGFFCVSEASLVADIVDDFFLALQKEKIQLHLVFDNVLDSGATSDIVKDQLKALARSAFKWGHQVLFTMQEKQAAESVADLNGATTRMTKLQNNSFGAYRWRQNEAEELIKTFADEINMTEVLAETIIPDEIGQWRPREIESFMRYGVKPLAPQHRMQAGWAAFTSYLTKSKLHKLKTKQPHRVAPCKWLFGWGRWRRWWWWCYLLIQACPEGFPIKRTRDPFSRVIVRPARHIGTCLGATTPEGQCPLGPIEPAYHSCICIFSSISSYPKSKVIMHQVSIAGFQKVCLFPRSRSSLFMGCSS